MNRRNDDTPQPESERLGTRKLHGAGPNGDAGSERDPGPGPESRGSLGQLLIPALGGVAWDDRLQRGHAGSGDRVPVHRHKRILIAAGDCEVAQGRA